MLQELRSWVLSNAYIGHESDVADLDRLIDIHGRKTSGHIMYAGLDILVHNELVGLRFGRQPALGLLSKFCLWYSLHNESCRSDLVAELSERQGRTWARVLTAIQVRCRNIWSSLRSSSEQHMQRMMYARLLTRVAPSYCFRHTKAWQAHYVHSIIRRRIQWLDPMDLLFPL